MVQYVDSQRQQVRESLRRLKFHDPVLQRYADAPALSSEDVVDILARARKLAQRTDDVDAGNAADIVTTIRNYRTS